MNTKVKTFFDVPTQDIDYKINLYEGLFEN